MKAAEEPGEVNIGKHGLSIIKVGRGSGKRARAVVIQGSGPAGQGALAEFGIEGFKNKEEDKAGKDGTERTALGKTLMLKEGVERVVGAAVPAEVGVFVE